jgi:hypothetical protein
MRLLTLTDMLLRHRIQISAVVFVLGCALSGVPIPLPTGGSFTVPVLFPPLSPIGHLLMSLGALGGAVATITRWTGLLPDQAQKLERAAKEAVKTGAPQTVITARDKPNVTIMPE